MTIKADEMTPNEFHKIKNFIKLNNKLIKLCVSGLNIKIHKVIKKSSWH